MSVRILRLALGFAAVSAFGIAAACGGGTPEPSTPPAPSATETPSASAAPLASEVPSAAPAPAASAAPSASAAPAGPPGPGDWDKWSHEQKLAYMKSDVMPKMGGLFHDFDAKRFAEPKCGLCHGAGVKDGSFKMPNPDLPKLDLSEAGMKKMHAHPSKLVEFMGKTVVPETAKLVGEAPFDPKTMTGFGCLECHTKK